MRFVRFGVAGRERPGLLDGEGRIRDLSDQVEDLAGAVLSDLARLDPAAAPPVEGPAPRLGPPVAGIGKYICLGLNFSDSAAEIGMQPPREPIVLLKATSAICGPNDPLRLPRGATRTDWEVELGVVIGRTASYVSEAEALSHVAGYVTLNDISERSFQMERAGQWTKGKSCDTFGPVGPWLVTPDEAGDPQALDLRLTVNHSRMQTGNTATMIYGVARIISYLSQFMTLHPGDLIATGTPPGVGMAKRPPVYLQPGDVMEAEVQGLGAQRQPVTTA